MRETFKAYRRFKSDPLWSRIPAGKWIDIGGGTDALPNSTCYDVPHDAQTCADLKRQSYQLVYSSHCIEHINDAPAALATWWSLVAPGGWLWVLAPDWQLYEHALWPSTLNAKHLWRCRLLGRTDYTERWLSLGNEAEAMAGAQVMRLAIQDTDYNYTITDPTVDQSRTSAEVSIELVMRKVV